MIPLGSTTATFAALRTAVAVPFGLALWRERRHLPSSLAQGVADASAALFVLGLTRPALRHALGMWWVVLFLFTLVWELFQLRGYVSNFTDPPPTTDEGFFTGLGWLGIMIWEVICVAVPLAAGFGLAFDAVAPNELTFPGAP